MKNRTIFKKNSISRKIFIPMMLIVILQAVIFTGAIWAVDTIIQLEDNAYSKLSDTVELRKNVLEGMMVNHWSNPEIYKELVNECADLHQKNSLGQSEDFTGNLVEKLWNLQQNASATGAFFFLKNGEGLYLRNLKSQSISMDHSNILVEFGSPKIVKQFGFTMDSEWKPKADFDETPYDFFIKPLKAVMENEGGTMFDYGYWSKPFYLNKNDMPVITYSIPLFDDNRKVYAVVGIEVTLNHLKSFLPYMELPLHQESSYVLGSWDKSTLRMEQIVIHGPYFKMLFGETNSVSFEKESALENVYHTRYDLQGKVAASIQPLKLYSVNTPFEDEIWALCGLASETNLLAAAHRLKKSIAAAFFTALAVGTLGAAVISAFFYRPISLLVKVLNQGDLENRGISLPKVNIYEIDKLSAAIEQMSTEQALARQRIEYERDYDVLTSLMNRRTFSLKVQACIDKLGDGLGVMVMWDLDNLKFMNDTYGHDFGDLYIQTAAKIFGSLKDYGGIVARRSGDEFFAFLSGHKTKEEYYQIISKVHERLSEIPFSLPNGDKIKIRASAGIVWYPEEADNYEELVRRVDFAMYDVKHTLKGQIKGFSAEAFKDNQLLLDGQEELNCIIENQKIRYAFQPVFDLATMQVYGYEALIRPQSDKIKNPNTLIRLAREQGKLYQIERLTWLLALEAFQNQTEEADNYRLFINSLPNITLSEDDIRLIEEKYPRLLKKLVIEMLEEDQATQSTFEKMERFCRKWQCEIALDDFGTGYNSEVSLLHLQPSYLKIDMVLIRDVHKDMSRQKMVANIISYAKMRDIKVIAEGVETEEELLTLKNMGAEYVQGYYTGKPDFKLKRR